MREDIVSLQVSVARLETRMDHLEYRLDRVERFLRIGPSDEDVESP